jgi:hypothetical protein
MPQDLRNRRREAVRTVCQSSALYEIADLLMLEQPENGIYCASVPFGKHAIMEFTLRPRSQKVGERLMRQANRMRQLARRVHVGFRKIFSKKYNGAFAPKPIFALMDGPELCVEIFGSGVLTCRSPATAIADIESWMVSEQRKHAGSAEFEQALEFVRSLQSN